MHRLDNAYIAIDQAPRLLCVSCALIHAHRNLARSAHMTAMPSDLFREGCVELSPPPELRDLLARVKRTAEDFNLVPVGLSEFEVNSTPTRVLSVEYWTGARRTEAFHTEVPIPEELQHVFAPYATELANLLEH